MKRIMAVFLAAVLLLATAACGEPAAAPPREPSVSELSITVSELNGTAHTIRGDGTTESLEVNSRLEAGDSIITERDSTVSLKVDELSAAITVSPSSEILFNTASGGEDGSQFVVVVRKGSISNSVDEKLSEGDIYEVCTSDMTMAIRGTDALVHCENGVTSVSLLTGYAVVRHYSDNRTYVVPSGIMGFFPPDEEPEFEFIRIDSYSQISAAAEAMQQKVAGEDAEYINNFEKNLKESYVVSESTYDFIITEPQVESEISADEGDTTTTASDDAVETTTETVERTTTTAAGTTAKTTKKTTAKTTKKTTSKSSVTTAAGTTASTSPTTPSSPTEPTSASDAAPTSASDAVSTTASTSPSTAPTTKPTGENYTFILANMEHNGTKISTAAPYQEIIAAVPYSKTITLTADNGQKFVFDVYIGEDNVVDGNNFKYITASRGDEGEYPYQEVTVMLLVASLL